MPPDPRPDPKPTAGADLDLDAVLDGLAFDDQDDLVRRARESLEETLHGLKLTPEEGRALAEIGAARRPTIVSAAVTPPALRIVDPPGADRSQGR